MEPGPEFRYHVSIELCSEEAVHGTADYASLPHTDSMMMGEALSSPDTLPQRCYLGCGFRKSEVQRLVRTFLKGKLGTKVDDRVADGNQILLVSVPCSPTRVLFHHDCSAAHEFAEPVSLNPDNQTRFLRIDLEPIGFKCAKESDDKGIHIVDVLRRLQQPVPQMILRIEGKRKPHRRLLGRGQVLEDLRQEYGP